MAIICTCTEEEEEEEEKKRGERDGGRERG